MILKLVLAIELGDFSLGAASLDEVLWFVAGVAMLTGITAIVIRWNASGHPDPFVGREPAVAVTEPLSAEKVQPTPMTETPLTDEPNLGKI